MKTYNLFKEYTWLVNTLHRFGRLTLEEINRRWLDTEMSEGVPIARTTFNRHRDAILDIFGIIIECDRKDGFRYYIWNEEVLDEESIQNWMLSTLSVNSVLSESKGVADRILLERIPSDGQFLHQFIDAMKRSVRVKVVYRRYGAASSTSTMTLDPYFVKLTNKRWYGIVKFKEPSSELFTLAFDRIRSLEVTDEKFVYDKDFDPAGWFRDCYGIVRDPEVPVEKVVIRAFGREAFYMRDLPLHPSQRELEAGEEHTDFELTLRPTEDFYTPLLSRGTAIKVLSPQWLADEIRRLHRESSELYG
jgi:hypothetical protein